MKDYFPDREIIECFPFKIIRSADLRYRVDQEDTLEEQIIEGVFPGTQLVADSIGAPGTPIGDAVALKLVRYPFDAARASDRARSRARRGAVELRPPYRPPQGLRRLREPRRIDLARSNATPRRALQAGSSRPRSTRA